MSLFPHLHHDFESVQRRRARPGNCSGSTTCNQVPPPHPRLLFLHGELIRNHQVLPHIDNLLGKERERENDESQGCCEALSTFVSSFCITTEVTGSRDATRTVDDTDYFYSNLNCQGSSRGGPHMRRRKPRLITCSVKNIISCFRS